MEIRDIPNFQGNATRANTSNYIQAWKFVLIWKVFDGYVKINFNSAKNAY